MLWQNQGTVKGLLVFLEIICFLLWEDDVKSDITRMKITNWKDCIRNRTKWNKLVEKVKTSLKL
jgi:hypothetical protein